MNPKPLISVIMPVYNVDRYVVQALESVFGQTYSHIEVICVDDGSSDKSLEVLSSFGSRITLLKNERNEGIAVTRNKGLAVARGDFLAFMDADDMWEPSKLAEQLEQFQLNSKLDISFTQMQCFISPELPEEVKRTRYCPPGVVAGPIAPTSLIRMEFFKKVGLFDPRWRIGEFVDWMARAKQLGAVIEMLPQPLLRRRIHGSNTGVTQRIAHADYVRIIKEALDRKRRSQIS